MAIHIRRREFIVTLAGAIAALPFAARAQRPSKIGVLSSLPENDPEGHARIAAFQEALEKLGWMEGRNVRLDVRWATPEVETIQRLAEELVALPPDLIVTQSTPGTAAVLQRTRVIPIIFVNIVDPVGSGLVANFLRPGGNVTGFVSLESTIVGKWLELLKEISPRIARVAFLFNPATASFAEYYLTPFKAVARSFAVAAIAAPVRDLAALETVIASLAEKPNGGLMIMPDSFLITHRAAVTSLAARHRVPAVYPYRHFTEVGGLLSYGNDQLDNYHRAASYADRILKGEKPSELPVRAPVKFEMTINLRTAKTLNLELPPNMVALADEVIE
jgi:putative tryptophan/tyrosine transport system substrate-binding protein